MKPHERYFSQQGNVDWFRFWLQNHKVPPWEKREQYARWREMLDKVEAGKTGPAEQEIEHWPEGPHADAAVKEECDRRSCAA